MEKRTGKGRAADGSGFEGLVLHLVAMRRAQILAEVGDEATTTVMTPINPRWDRFARKLARAVRSEGCDAESLRLSERLLVGMDGIDVEASLAHFRRQSGHCDCEVLVNVGTSMVRPRKCAGCRPGIIGSGTT